MIPSIIRYFGGKYRLLKYIFPFPAHVVYIEVFGGSGVVLMNKIPSDQEVYNDINAELINFWFILRNRHLELQGLAQYLPDSRFLFKAFHSELKNPSKNDLTRALAYFYVNRHCFSSMNKGYHGIDTKADCKERLRARTFQFDLDRINLIWERIKLVNFECLDFRKLLTRSHIDLRHVLLYLDPPYVIGGDEY